MERDESALPVVSVVLPCFNEREHVDREVVRICAALDASPFDYELIAIDDKSTDDTLAVLQRLQPQYPHLRVVAFARNGGTGTARRIGTRDARGDVVVWTDADLSYPNEQIPDLVQHLVDHPEVDQVVGARTSEQGRWRPLRRTAKWGVRRLAEWLTKAEIPDLNSGLRAFRRGVSLPYLRLLPPGFSCVSTLTLAFLANQHVVDYVPITYQRRSGRSKFHPVRDAYRYVLQVLRMVMYFNPLQVLMPVALALVLVAALKGLLFDQIRQPFYLPANTVTMFLSGLILASLALLADLIVRSRAP